MNRKKQTARRRRTIALTVVILLAAVCFFFIRDHISAVQQEAGAVSARQDGLSLSTVHAAPETIPEYDGTDCIILNGNEPNFTSFDITHITGETYSPQDALGRCGEAYAMLERSMMPEEARTGIGDIRPTGWHQEKYPDIIPSEPPYLYNRCHLIAHALTGQNDNARNLITGTRYLNVELMLPMEIQVAQYLDHSEHHVLYRVTPFFKDDELLARGVEMEAYSVEDDGEGVKFHVFLYNVQPGIAIDYATGISKAAAPAVAGEAGAAGDADVPNRVILGDEQFDAYIPLLSGKRVALFSNHTGIVGDVTSGGGEVPEGQDVTLIPFGYDADGSELSYGEHILDALMARGINVACVFSPEHGFRGTAEAGESVNDTVDAKTGVPVYSLYGNGMHLLPADSMDAFDTLVVDLQDVGVRFYTYYITMYHLMDACATAGKKVIILDRPNPNGFYVDGPVLRDAFRSGVGELPIPVVYGMTWGELAKMINGEGWLSAGKDALALTVVPCQNYTHQTKHSLICAPSPNLKDMRAVYLYASVCLFENTAMSVGRGTAFPFEAYGSPYLAGTGGYDFSFMPQSVSGAANPPFMDEVCYGINLRELPVDEIWESGINLEYLVSAYHAVTSAGAVAGAADGADASDGVTCFWGTPDGNGRYWIDLLTGTDEVRLQIEAGMTAEEIKAGWQEEIEAFLEQRRPYLLYEE